MMFKKLFAIIIILPTLFFAQELNATVTVNVEQLPSEYKDKLNDFGQTVQDYLNNNKYADQNWQGDKIDCTFNIFFLSGSGDVNYTAQAVITSTRPILNAQKSSLMLNIMDDKWSFSYESGQSMNFDLNTFNGLKSFLDFYALVIIGVDADSYDPYGGSPYFSKAIEIGVLGSSSKNSKGWDVQSSAYNRRVYVNDLLDSKLQEFRNDFFNYHYNGLDLLYSGAKYKPIGQKNIAKLIEDLYSNKVINITRNVVLTVFFNAKAGEIAESLADYPDKTIFNKLLKIDPSNSSKYLKVIEKEN
jgi:hypothetical protein